MASGLGLHGLPMSQNRTLGLNGLNISNCLKCTLFINCTIESTVKPVLNGHSKRRPKIDFRDQLSLNAGQKYCRMLQESILQNILPSFSYHLSLRHLFCLMLSVRLRQVLLYGIVYLSSVSCNFIPSAF